MHWDHNSYALKQGTNMNTRKQAIQENNSITLDSNVTEAIKNNVYFTKSPALLEGQYYPSKFPWRHYPSLEDHLKKIQTMPNEDMKDMLIQTIEEHNIHVVGINLCISELRALRAIQRLFTATNYQGNLPEKEKSFDGNNPFFFTGYITPLKIKIADYLTTYEVNKKVMGDGKARFHANEREEACKALTGLASKMFYFYLTKKKWEKNIKGVRQEKIDVIQTVSPLFKLYSFHKEISQRDLEDLLMTDFSNAKVQHIIIEPTPIMMLDIDNYFLLLPPYEKDIRKITEGKRIPKEVYTFTGYLIYQAEMKRSKKQNDWLTISITSSALIYKLRLESYFSRTLRNPQRGYDIIAKSIECALKAEYILSYAFVDDVYIFQLNPAKFFHQKNN